MKQIYFIDFEAILRWMMAQKKQSAQCWRTGIEMTAIIIKMPECQLAKIIKYAASTSSPKNIAYCFPRNDG